MEQQKTKFPFNVQGLSNPPINTIKDYQYGRNIRAYLKQKLETCGKDDTELMLATGYANLRKFEFHRAQWHYLKRQIPISYLEAIGVDMEILKYVVELDNENYQKAIKLPRFPACYIRRLMAAFYQTVELPDCTSEKDAIELIQKTEGSHRCCINYPGLLGLYIEPDGKVDEIHYVPSMEIINKHFVKFRSDGSSVGTMRLGR
ncbi:MAG: hypothetical protein WC614_07625 [bacterium]